MKFMLMSMYIAAFAALFGMTMFGVWLFELILTHLGFWWTVTLFAIMGSLRMVVELSKDKSPITFLKS